MDQPWAASFLENVRAPAGSFANCCQRADPVPPKTPAAAPPPAPTETAPEPDASPAKPASPFNRRLQVPRQTKRAAVQGGRVLPPAPSWMHKPLKPPGVR